MSRSWYLIRFGTFGSGTRRGGGGGGGGGGGDKSTLSDGRGRDVWVARDRGQLSAAGKLTQYMKWLSINLV